MFPPGYASKGPLQAAPGPLNSKKPSPPKGHSASGSRLGPLIPGPPSEIIDPRVSSLADKFEDLYNSTKRYRIPPLDPKNPKQAKQLEGCLRRFADAVNVIQVCHERFEDALTSERIGRAKDGGIAKRYKKMVKANATPEERLNMLYNEGKYFIYHVNTIYQRKVKAGSTRVYPAFESCLRGMTNEISNTRIFVSNSDNFLKEVLLTRRT